MTPVPASQEVPLATTFPDSPGTQTVFHQVSAGMPWACWTLNSMPRGRTAQPSRTPAGM